MKKKIFKESDSGFYDYQYFETLQLRYETKAQGSRIRHIMSSFGNLDGKKILDIGCGGGFFTNELANSGAKEVLGIDYSNSAIKFANDTFPESRASFKQHSAYDLKKLGDNLYDIVTVIDVIEHMSNQDALIDGVRTLLKKDGLVFISTDVEENIWATKFIGKWLHRTEWLSHEGRMYRAIKISETVRRRKKVNYHDSHIKTLTYDQIVSILKKHGFEIIKHKTFPLVSVPVRDWLLKLLPIRHRGDCQYIIAKKNSNP